MRAILIDPFERSVSYIETDLSLPEVYRIVGEDSIDICRPFRTHRFEAAIVGDHSALQTPPLPHFFITGYPHPLYGKTLVYGLTGDGKDRSTSLSVEQVHRLIEWMS